MIVNAKRHDAELVVEGFLEALLVKKDVPEALSFLDPDIYWTDTLIVFEADGLDEATLGLQKVMATIPDYGEVSVRFMKVRDLGADLAELSCFSSLRFTGCPSRPAFAKRHLVFLCRRYPGKDAPLWKIVSMHVSLMDAGNGDRLYLNQGADAECLAMTVADHIRDDSFDIIRRSIPGGMLAGYLEEGFPLYYINQNMLDYLGFDYDGFVESIGGKVLNGIHPDDRERVCQSVSEAFLNGQEYEVQYRMAKSDGSWIWVNDIGKQGISADNRPVCLSVVRDITEQKEAKARLEQEIAEKNRQAMSVENLFQTVMCGIVDYWLDPNGTVTFIRANQEAIRIFGCSREAFWAKKDWDIVSLVAEEDRRLFSMGSQRSRMWGPRSITSTVSSGRTGRSAGFSVRRKWWRRKAKVSVSAAFIWISTTASGRNRKTKRSCR